MKTQTQFTNLLYLRKFILLEFLEMGDGGWIDSCLATWFKETVWPLKKIFDTVLLL